MKDCFKINKVGTLVFVSYKDEVIFNIEEISSIEPHYPGEEGTTHAVHLIMNNQSTMRLLDIKLEDMQELFEEIDKVLLQKSFQALFETFKVDDEGSVSMPSKYETVTVPL
jgi:hypothetical protein